MEKKLKFSEYLTITSMLFGLFFGAGNLIFPVSMGQLAGQNMWQAVLGFLVTGVGLPLLGVAALGISRCNGLAELSARVGKRYGVFFTCSLYLTIGPFFAIPRCATVSYTVGVEPMLGGSPLYLALFSGGAPRRVVPGAWRTAASGPMQVVSGYIGHEKVHFEAPAAERLEREISRFLEWFNAPPVSDPVLGAGIAHLWFVTIHPFEDGNGRIARAIADCALARADGCPQRFYSMSGQIERERRTYYEILERTQKGDLEITPWLEWFLACLRRAVDGAETTLAAVFRKASVWNRANRHALNARQRAILNRLLDGFEGRLTSGKYAKLAKCSQDTALRDIRELMEFGILRQGKEGGRSTGYELSGEGDA